jgi:hypothetical protein
VTRRSSAPTAGAQQHRQQQRQQHCSGSSIAAAAALQQQHCSSEHFRSSADLLLIAAASGSSALLACIALCIGPPFGLPPRVVWSGLSTHPWQHFGACACGSSQRRGGVCRKSALVDAMLSRMHVIVSEQVEYRFAVLRNDKMPASRVGAGHCDERCAGHGRMLAEPLMPCCRVLHRTGLHTMHHALTAAWPCPGPAPAQHTCSATATRH